MRHSLDIKNIRNRIVELRVMKPRDLLDHPGQWKDHPVQQAEALAAALRDIGQTDALKAWHSEREGGKLATWDGHLRKGLDPDVPWPILITDLNDAEADEALLIHDPIGALARADVGMLDSLMQTVQTGEAALQELIAKLAADTGVTSFDPMAEWEGMPEFEQEDLSPYQSIHVNFKCREDVEQFASLVGQKLSEKTRSIWYPEAQKIDMTGEAWRDES